MAVQTRDRFEVQLKERVPPVLSDGTPLSELVNIDKREVKMRVLNDPELHRLELQKIWAKCWIPICHETDLPKVGDFKRGVIGEDPVIVTRAQDGSINMLLNVCSHRGMEICWGDEGNSATFKCPYHGWVFDGTGKLLGAPFEKEMYGDWDKSEFPLRTAKVASRHGVYFATFNPNPPSLEDYLTEFVGMFDLAFGTYEMVSTTWSLFASILGPNALIPANWKAVAEQNSGDGYHTVTLHHSLFEQGMVKGRDVRGWALDCYDTSSTGGHGVRVAELELGVFGVADHIDPFPFGWFVAGSMFPSASFGLNAAHIPTPEGRVPMFQATALPSVPYGTTNTGFAGAGLGVSVVNKEFADFLEARAGMLGNMRMGANGGEFGNDDPESWMSMTRVARGAVGGEQTIKYNALEGASEPADFPTGLGLVHRGFAKDDNQWHWWLAYYDWMTRE
jgi:nitrite reductase/ring-hydroxylating ferredoxin subunit